jgi:hypothetical protein
MRSPSESLVRGFKIWRFLFISCPFPFVATLMPSALVNSSSMTRCAVIPFLYTLKLTVERHFCSIFEHKVLDGPMKKRRYLSVSTGADFGAVNFIATK